MPPKSSRTQFPSHVVTAVLVSHDGARWLPECLAALSAQTRPPQRVVAVDTGSLDSSPDLIAAALGAGGVVRLAREAALGDAVQAGLDAFEGAPPPPGVRGAVTEWVWLLHDDCAPEPEALQELLAAAADSPSVAALAPKALSWDGRRLIEMGVTVDSSGARQTGLEARELDQGQHDDVGDVLAVGTAGLLLRRGSWDAVGGLDRSLGFYADDLDLGWRLNAAGERVRVVPAARMRHAAALLSGERTPPDHTAAPRATARQHGMQVVLANTSRFLAPVLAVRYAVECLLRALVLTLFARRPRAAADELRALGGLVAHVGWILAARRRRRERSVAHRELRGLLAPASWRWRRLGDVVVQTFGGRAAAAQRQRRRAPVESGPVAEEAESLQLDAGSLLRVLLRPGVLLTVGLTVLALVASRDLLSGTLHGGRLLPPPRGASDLWSTYVASWHGGDLGSTTLAPPSLAVLALLSSVLLGKASLAVSVLLVGAVPLAGLSAYFAAGAATRSGRLRVWAAVGWGLLPALTGAVAGGRIDVVVALVLLPLSARALAGALRSEHPAWSSGCGAGLLLAAVTAMAPLVWPLTGVALVLILLVNRQLSLGRLRVALVALAVAPLTLLPWTGSVVSHPRLLVDGMGLPDALASRPLHPTDLLLLHPGGAAQPWAWLALPFVLAALIGVVRRDGGSVARAGVVMLVVGVGAAVLVSRLPAAAGAGGRPWAGVPLAFAGMGMLLSGLVAARLARPALRAYSFGWRQPLAALLGAAAIASTVGLGICWVWRGADGPVDDRQDTVLPVFAAAELARATAPRVVVLRDDGTAVGYGLVDGPDGPRLGAADVTRRGRQRLADRRLADAVQLLIAGQSGDVPVLTEFGISMVLVPNSESGIAGRLADVDGLSRVPTGGAVVWRTDAHAGRLVVLPAATAAAVSGGADLPAGTPRRLLPFDGDSADTTVPTGAAGRLLVLAEPADGAWRATVDGSRLVPTRAYGWAQAWQLPADGGRVKVWRSSGQRGWQLVVELVLVVGVGLLALPGRREDTAAAEPQAPGEVDA